MILDFGDGATADIYHGANTRVARRCLPRHLWQIAQRKLDRVHRSKDLRDLKDPPANRLEALHGKWAGFYSLRINDQYRIVLRFADANASDVRIVDYH